MMKSVKIVVNAFFLALAYSAIERSAEYKLCRVSALKLTRTLTDHQRRILALQNSDLWKNVSDDLRDDSTPGTKAPSASELEELLNEVLNDGRVSKDDIFALKAKADDNNLLMFLVEGEDTVKERLGSCLRCAGLSAAAGACFVGSSACLLSGAVPLMAGGAGIAAFSSVHAGVQLAVGFIGIAVSKGVFRVAINGRP